MEVHREHYQIILTYNRALTITVLKLFLEVIPKLKKLIYKCTVYYKSICAVYKLIYMLSKEGTIKYACFHPNLY